MKHLFLLVALFSSFAANAASFSFTGNFANDSDHQVFSFSVTDETDVLIRTFGFGGGTNSLGQTIAAGGFDPMIALFHSDGTFIASNDDCNSYEDDCGGINEDYDDEFADDYVKYDSLLDWELEEGSYFVTISLYGQDFTQMPSLNEIIWTGTEDNDFDGRTNFWALDISGEKVDAASLVNTSPVPVPAAFWLFGPALAGVLKLKRKPA